MICEKCEEHGGFEGDPPSEAEYLVTTTAPPGPAEANIPQILCLNHAAQMTEAYIGFGWAVHADRLVANEPERWISSLIEPGTNTTPSGG